jgi:hypothetical protein
LWSAEPGRELFEPGGVINGVDFHPDGRHAVVLNCFYDRAVIRDMDAGSTVATFRRQHRCPSGLTLSPDGTQLALPGTHGETALWETATGHLIRVLRGHAARVFWAHFSRDGRLLATCSWDSTARIWDVQTGQTLHVLQGHKQLLWDVEFTPDSRQLVTASADGTARVWDVATGQCRHVLEGHHREVHYLAIAPDGRTLATIGLEPAVRFWDLRSGKPIGRWELEGGGWILSYSPDGKRLMLRSSRTPGYGLADPPSLEIWDVAAGRPLLVFRGHTEMGMGSFSADGRRVLASHWIGKLRQWEAFPWREVEYPEVDAPEVGGQSDRAAAQRIGGTLSKEQERLALRIRRYADRYWQERLAAERAGAQAGPPRVVNLPLDRSLIDARDPATPPELIDLTDYYTSPVQEVSHFGLEWGWDTDLRQLSRGVVTFNGVRFDVRGTIQLRFQKHPLGGQARQYFTRGVALLQWEDIPERVDGIHVGRCFGRLHALLGTYLKVLEGQTIGGLVLHYADGSQHECPIVYGRHVRDWWTANDRRTDAAAARIAWEGDDPSPRVNWIPAWLRLYQTFWDNPRPEVEVRHIDFVSALNGSAPFLIAVTVE